MSCPECKGISYVYTAIKSKPHLKMVKRCSLYTRYFSDLESLDDPVIDHHGVCSAAVEVHRRLLENGGPKSGNTRGRF